MAICQEPLEPPEAGKDLGTSRPGNLYPLSEEITGKADLTAMSLASSPGSPFCTPHKWVQKTRPEWLQGECG